LLKIHAVIYSITVLARKYIRGLSQPSATCILNIALPTRNRCDKF